ncbi:MAG: 30S ribosomal protein S17e [Fervidicoccaceae archaeon]
MGKVRTAMVKRTARKLLSMYPTLFTESFESNKQIVRKLVDIPSKRVQNRIAGYLTRLVKINKRKSTSV